MDSSAARYDTMSYRRAGRSGVDLPAISLGLWHNFGGFADRGVARSIVLGAFDRGITCFDIANEYGPTPGAAESTFGKILRSDLRPFRDEFILTTKAGFRMWDGPYGSGGSRKYLLASLDQSLSRLGVDYVDVYYHHCPDPSTPLEETLAALDHAVRSGKALYIGLSNYDADLMRKALEILRELGTPCLLNQPQYSLLWRKPEEGLFDVLREAGVGCAVYSPLAQGILTSKYLEGIPQASRAADPDGYLTEEQVHRRRELITALNDIARDRGQTLAQLALSWVLRRKEVTSAIVGASRLEQLDENLGALNAPPIGDSDHEMIDRIVRRAPINDDE